MKSGIPLVFALLCQAVAAEPVDGLETGVAQWRKGNYTGAVSHWRPLAESGLAEAQLFMAFAYRTGRGVSADDVTAAQWYERAARQGLPEAQFELGFMYELGLGVPMDAEMSAGWYAQATAGEFCPAELPAGGRLGSRHDD